MVRGDLKHMEPRYLRGLSFLGYGCTIAVGVGIPIPILDEDMAFFCGVDNSDILMPVRDYDHDYPNANPRIIKHVSYEELLSGEIEVLGNQVECVPMTSYLLSREIAEKLKSWIVKGEFLLTEAQERIPAE